MKRALLVRGEFVIALLGPVTASVPVMMRTLAIVQSMIVIGQPVGTKTVDPVFAMAVALAVLLIGATIAVY